MEKRKLTYYEFSQLRKDLEPWSIPGFYSGWEFLDGVSSEHFSNYVVIGMKHNGFAYVCFEGNNGPEGYLGRDSTLPVVQLPTSYKSKNLATNAVYGHIFSVKCSDYYQGAYVTTSGVLKVRGNYPIVDCMCDTLGSENVKVVSSMSKQLELGSTFNMTIHHSNTANEKLYLQMDSLNQYYPIYINGIESSEENHTLPAGNYKVHYTVDSNRNPIFKFNSYSSPQYLKLAVWYPC